MPLVRHPDVAGISFTGSNEVGRDVNIEAARNLKRVALELGGKNAIIVLDDADLDLAVDGIIWSAFGTTGQRCTACSRLIVQKGIRDDLTGRLLDRISRLRLGHGLEADTDVGPLINASQLERVHSYMDVARSDGAHILTGDLHVVPWRWVACSAATMPSRHYAGRSVGRWLGAQRPITF